MNVGDWVEFDSIVVQEATPAGSAPAARKLGRTRRGMVIGQRTVYEVAHGAPPRLLSRRNVLLVAVAPGRAYRVELAEARPANPPRRRKKASLGGSMGPNFGDWVEFDVAVAPEPTAGGSRPAARSLGKVRRGQVVGVRNVFEVASGTPPALSNRQTVLLVAVSMHRRYRVFPADAQTVAAPAPKAAKAAVPRAARVAARRAGVGPLVPALAINIANLTSGGAMGANGRATISQADLDVLVADAINRQVASSAIFTAYDITVDLRGSNPGLDIPHAAVRQTVHTHMQPYLASDLYESETASFGTTSALRYVPA